MARIEIDEQLDKDLQQIKLDKFLYGKGFTSTIRYLVDHYNQHKDVSEVLERELQKIPEQMQKSVETTFRNIVLNLIKKPEL